MRFLITGGCGFLGTNLVLKLLADHDNELVIVDNFSIRTEDDLFADLKILAQFHTLGDDFRKRVRILKFDITDSHNLNKTAKNCDILIHLAAQTGVIKSIEDPLYDCQQNIIGTLNVLEAARKSQAQAVIFASSGAPTGDADPPIHEKTLPAPKSPYGASKLAGETYCKVYEESYGLKTICLRFGNAYGPCSDHKTSIVASVIRSQLTQNVLNIYGDGDQTRDFIYVDDIVSAIMTGVATSREVSGLFQIACGMQVSVNHLVSSISTLVRQKTGIELLVKHSTSIPGEIHHTYSNIKKASEILGWAPKTELQHGLETTVDYFISRYDRELST